MTPPAPATDLLLYESPPPGKIRALSWFAAAIMAGCIRAGVFVFERMTADSEPTQLAPLALRVTFALVILGLGVAFFGGMLLYLRFYTTRLFLVAGADIVRVETLRLWGRSERTIDVSHISSTAYHHGQMELGRAPSVDAPWFWVKVEGGRGFLLDVQGTFFDTDTLARMLTADYAVPIGGDVDRLK